MAPDSNGSTAQWTSGTGSSDYAEVDEIPTDDDTTYIASSGSANQTHLVGLASAATAGISGNIFSAKGWLRVREGTSGTSANLLRIRAGGSNSDTGTTNETTSYANKFLVQIELI
jgi:hypothetical protein